MPKVTATCPVCGKDYQTYEGMGYRMWCSVRCQFAPDEDRPKRKCACDTDPIGVEWCGLCRPDKAEKENQT